MDVTIIGAGNVATQLALALKKAGHNIVNVFNRTNEAGIDLAKTVGADFTSDIKALTKADVYLIAVKDDAIGEVANQIAKTDTVIAHTSGTKSKELLQVAGNNFGIFYPLQTMTKFGKVDFKNVPVLYESSNENTSARLKELASSISKNVHYVDEQQRQWIHVGAVFANNFTNHLFGISESLLGDHGLGFEILKPLIFKSIENLNSFSPNDIQTGPAVRKDYETIEKHIQLLGDDARLQNIYRILTESIILTQAERHL